MGVGGVALLRPMYDQDQPTGRHPIRLNNANNAQIKSTWLKGVIERSTMKGIRVDLGPDGWITVASTHANRYLSTMPVGLAETTCGDAPPMVVQPEANDDDDVGSNPGPQEEVAEREVLRREAPRSRQPPDKPASGGLLARLPSWAVVVMICTHFALLIAMATYVAHLAALVESLSESLARSNAQVGAGCGVRLPGDALP